MMIKDRMRMNGLDENLIKHLTNTVIKERNENRINTIDSSDLQREPIQFVKIPYINEFTSSKIQKISKERNLSDKIRLIFYSDKPIWRK